MLAVYERPGACHSLQCHRKAIHLSWTRSCSISLLWFCCSLAWISADRSAPRIINIWGHVNRDCSGTLNHEKKITFFFTLFHKRYYSKEEKKKKREKKKEKSIMNVAIHWFSRMTQRSKWVTQRCLFQEAKRMGHFCQIIIIKPLAAFTWTYYSIHHWHRLPIIHQANSEMK